MKDLKEQSNRQEPLQYYRSHHIHLLTVFGGAGLEGIVMNDICRVIDLIKWLSLRLCR